MISFQDFVHKDELKNKALSNEKDRQIFCSLTSLNDVGIYLGDGPFKTDLGIVNLHATKGTIWAAYINQDYFDSYGCHSPNKLTKFII